MNKVAATLPGHVVLTEYERTFSAGCTLSGDLDWRVSVDENTPLVPAHHCHTVIAEYKLPVAGPSEIMPYTRRMIGSFPYATPHDAETYLVAVSEMFAQYPIDAVKSAVNQVVQEKTSLPKVAELRGFLDEYMRPIRYIVAVAEEHLVERKRREDAAAEDNRRGRSWNELSPEEQAKYPNGFNLAKIFDVKKVPAK